MKKLAIIMYMAALFSTGMAQTTTQILDKVQKNERISSSKSYVKQTITTSNGSKRTLEMVSYTKDYNKLQLSIYKNPARVNGDKILMTDNGDNIWFYTPKTDRVRHLASHAKKQKVQGSDFSYEDFENWDYKNDFKSTLLGKEKSGSCTCYKIKLVPTESGPHYSQMIMWVDTEKYIVHKADYYEDGELLKSLECKDIKKIENHWYAMTLIMTNKQDGGSTAITTTNIQIGIGLDDNMFTTNYLTKR